MNERPYIIAWIAIAVLSLGLIVGLFLPAQASDWKVGLLLASDHMDDGYTCDGERRSLNEDNRGLYVVYKGFMVGRFENSYSGCRDLKYSNMLAYEYMLGSHKALDFSITAGIADGYQDFEDGFEEYRAWASVNMKWNLFRNTGPKMFYAYRVAAYSLEWSQ